MPPFRPFARSSHGSSSSFFSRWADRLSLSSARKTRHRKRPPNGLHGKHESLEPRLVLDSTVVFNEIMYNPTGADESLEWVELYNQMAVDLDISAWTFGGIDFEFPEGTIVPGGEYLVVAKIPGAIGAGALGPFGGQLSNGGERLELFDRSGRLMNEINYQDAGKWPLAPDGSGASLAKIIPSSGSEEAANWTSSLVVGGTPGSVNFPNVTIDKEIVPLVSLQGNWNYDAAGNDLGTAWREADFDDSGWQQGPALIFAGDAQSSDAAQTQVADVTVDFSTEFGGREAVHLVDNSGVNGDAHSTSVDTMWLSVAGDPAPELTFDLGEEFELNELRIWNYNEFRPDLPNRVDELLGRGVAVMDVLIAGEDGNFLPLIEGQELLRSPGGEDVDFSETIDFGGATARFVKFIILENHNGKDFTNPGSSDGLGNFVGLSEVQFFGLRDQRQTLLPAGRTTYYFRTEFDLAADPSGAEMTLRTLIDDGAVFYLNGQEIHRQNMPSGEISAATFAESEIAGTTPTEIVTLPGTALHRGRNVLAVEVHQADAQDTDMLFGAELNATIFKVGDPVSTSLIGLNDALRFEDSGTDLGTQWRETAFDDSAWGGNNAQPGPYFAGDEPGGEQVRELIPIESVSATSSLGGGFSRLDTFAIDGSGLNPDGSHTVTPDGFMWLNNGVFAAPNDTSPEIVFDLGSVTTVGEMKVWNYNEGVPDLTGRGIRTADILIAGEDGIFSTLIEDQFFDKAPGIGNVDFSQLIDLGGVQARFIKFDINSNHGGDNQFVGLSEIQFFTPDKLIATELAFGATTYYFRKSFEFSGAIERTDLLLNTTLDDGAVFYLNGQEIYRQNIPQGEPSFDTFATQSVVGTGTASGIIRLSGDALQNGVNVLAIEVHQANDAEQDMLFDVSLVSEIFPPLPADLRPPNIALSEVAAGGDADFWIELTNPGNTEIALDQFVVASTSGQEFVFSDVSLSPGEFLVLTESDLGFDPAIGERIFLYSATRSLVIDAARVRATLRGRMSGGDGDWLQPDVATPGAANHFALRDEIVINEIMFHHRPDPATPGSPGTFGTEIILPMDAQWRFDQSGTDFGTAWREPDFDDSLWGAGPALFFVESSALPGPKNTPLTIGEKTYYFRTEFELGDDFANLDLQLQHIIDDGAVFYVNGQEIFRFNMPSGEITHQTNARPSVSNAKLSAAIALSGDALVSGTNVLAVEVHQRTNNSSDVVFGAELSLTTAISPPIDSIPFAKNDEEWIELYNRSDQVVDLTDWRLDDAVDFAFAPGTTIAPGEYVVVANDAVALAEKYPAIRILGTYSGSLNNSSEQIVLKDDLGNPADVVRYYDDGRWPEFADGGGASLELRNPDGDNSVAEAWAASREGDQSEWNTYTYRGIAQRSAVGPDSLWREFVFGLLSDGEVLIDDISVIENPDRANTEFIANGSFDRGDLGWRMIGNHGHSEVIDDPNDPGNKVLRLVATSATEHMHNQINTTFAGGETIVNGTEYEISYRAKWIGGSNQLNTRLYFNRLARTTIIQQTTLSGTPGAQNSTFETNVGPTYHDFKHTPAVPSPGEIVTVSVAAADPDGVASLTLWYSVDSGAFQSVAMSSPDSGNYSAQIPGQAAGRIVQFYVEGSDTLDSVSTFPAKGVDSRALFKVDSGEAAENGLHNLRIILTPDDAAFQRATINLMSNDRIGATVIYNETEVFYNVGVRLSGSERARPFTPRRSFAVRFNSDQLFRGEHRGFTLDRSESTGFGQQEILTHTAMNHAGGLPGEYNDLVHIMTPDAQFTGSAELQLARYSDVFLDSQYENGGDGFLFEYELVYFPTTANAQGFKLPQPDGTNGAGIRNLGSDKEDFRWTFLVKNNRAVDNFDQLREFTRVMGLTGSAFNNQIDDVIDVEQWLRANAIATLSGAGDNYTAGSQHNAQFYVRPEDNRVLYFPHDLDAFIQTNPNITANGDLNKIIRVPARLRSYLGHLHDIITTTYNRDYMSHFTTNYGDLLPGQNFSAHLSGITQRSNNVMNQVRGRVREVPFRIATAGPLNVGGASTANLTGSGWINVREIRLAGSDVPLDVTWTTADDWAISVPVDNTTDTVVLEAYDFQGNLLDTASIVVNSTALRPIIDQLRVVEVMFNPDGKDTAGEFIELQNVSDQPIDSLAGVAFVEGIQFVMPEVSLAAGERVVVVRDIDAFQAAHGNDIPIVGAYTGSALDNAGEAISLVDSDGAVIQQFTYNDDWYPETDGGGHSLVIVDATGDLANWSTADGWRASLAIDGSPGEEDKLVGDLDGDGRIGVADVSIFQSHFGQAMVTAEDGDLNSDGVINATDFRMLVANFGQGIVISPQPAASIPFVNEDENQRVQEDFVDVAITMTDRGESIGMRSDRAAIRRLLKSRLSKSTRSKNAEATNEFDNETRRADPADLSRLRSHRSLATLEENVDEAMIKEIRWFR